MKVATTVLPHYMDPGSYLARLRRTLPILEANTMTNSRPSDAIATRGAINRQTSMGLEIQVPRLILSRSLCEFVLGGRTDRWSEL